MLSYVLAGLALGAVYAIAASSLLITYVSSGVFNLAFAAMAFTVARVFYALDTEAGWGLLPSAAVALLVVGPALGMALYALLFRHLRLRSMLVKLVATLGLSVALPPVVELALGKLVDSTASGLAPRPLGVVRVFGATVNGDQIATYIGLLVVLGGGTAVLRFTDVGLKVRALVDSEALTALNGVSPSRVAMGVWGVSGALAGLAGVLLAPTAGLSVTGMTYMMSAAFACVVAAQLRNLGLAVVVALVMGVATSVVQKYLDPTSALTAAVVPSVPFAFMLAFLLYYAFRGQARDGTAGGALDRAVAPQGGDPALASAAASGPSQHGLLSPGSVAAVAVVGLVAVLPFVLDGYWTGLAAAGIALAIALLSYTLVTGEGGMVWLCQITFAGMGAVLAAELAARGWPSLLAVLLAPLVVVPVGVALGALTIRLGNLYVALVTLTFGLLVQTLVLTQDPFYNFGSGVAIARPGFAEGADSFALLCLAVFVVLGLLVVNVRRSTAGLAMAAVRSSEDGARTLGLSVLHVKVLVSALATYVAGVGGGFLALSAGSTLPDSFNPYLGLVWLAVLVTIGSRSVVAALVAGLLFSLMPALFGSYLPDEVAEVPTILFGLGAIALARHPEGVVAQTGHDLSRLLSRRRPQDERGAGAPPATPRQAAGPPTDPRPPAGVGSSSTGASSRGTA